MIAGGRCRALKCSATHCAHPVRSRCRFPRHIFPQEDLGLAHRDALAPALDDLQIGATLSSDRKRLINAKIL